MSSFRKQRTDIDVFNFGSNTGRGFRKYARERGGPNGIRRVKEEGDRAAETRLKDTGEIVTHTHLHASPCSGL